MTTTIQETVSTALRDRGLGSYADSAGPVIDVLVDRERNISEQLLTIASDLGADPGDIREQLSRLGMAVPEPEPEEEDEDDEPSDEDLLRRVDALDEIMRRLDSLTEFARRNGYGG